LNTVKREFTRLDAVVVGLVVAVVVGFLIVAALRDVDPVAGIILATLLVGLVLLLEVQRRQFLALNGALARLAHRTARVQRRAGEIGKLRRRLRGVREVAVQGQHAIREVSEQVKEVQAALDSQLTALGRAVSAQIEYEQQRLSSALAEQAAVARRSSDLEPEALQVAVEAIRQTVIFDAEWYVSRHPDAVEDPALHYVRYGAQQGTDPHPTFHSGWYLRRHPEARGWPTVLNHYLERGAEAGFDPHPLFASSWYARRYLGGRLQPPALEHYLTRGHLDGSDPHPLFDVTWYRKQHSRWLDPDEDPLVHFLLTGAALGLDPSPSVDIADISRRLLVSGPRDPLSMLLERETFAVGALPSGAAAIAPPVSDPMVDAKWDYVTRRVYERDPTAVLYRIIGNDLPPRHRRGQSLENVRFILQHEPTLAGCERRWVLNRITDDEQEAAIIELLEQHHQPYLRIPFEEQAYRRIGWRFQDFERPGVTYGKALDDLPEPAQRVALDHIYHDKNRYVMNNNGARNAALRDGRGRANWILPWDGNCFLTAEAWDEFREAVATHPHAKYVVVPMARVLDNASLLVEGMRPQAREEPQIAFRFDAAEEFDETARYGRRPKVKLFYRLGLEGPWDDWLDLPWESMPRDHGPEAGQYIRAGWVARLFSGERHLEADMKGRGLRRIEAIRGHIDRIDERLVRRRFRQDRLFAVCEDTLAFQRDAVREGATELGIIFETLRSEAEEALKSGPFSVLDKTTCAPSGDPHDYWHPAPYWWPDPDSPDGRPYIRKDGERVPGTELGEPFSEQYDRTALQRMLDASYKLALAWYLTADERFAEHGARLVRTWFIDPATRMNPNLSYAQARIGHAEDQGQPTGIIEFSDLYQCLDAVRLLERSGHLDGADSVGFRDWLVAYRGWLSTSWQGEAERAAPNNHGTWYEVQMAAVCAFLDDVTGLLESFKRVDERRFEHFATDGKQPHELKRTTSLHYCTYNLQGWMTLAQMGRRVGLDLYRYVDDGKGIEEATRWLLPFMERPWPFEQRHPFDFDRLAVLGHQAEAADPGVLRELGLDLRPAFTLRSSYSVHDGIRPFWQLGIPGLTVTRPAGVPLTR
jgi:hypothetical protein